MGLGDGRQQARPLGPRLGSHRASLQLFEQRAQAFVVARLVVEADEEAKRGGARQPVVVAGGHRAPTFGVPDRLSRQAHQPGRAGGAGQEHEVVRRLDEGVAGEPKRLVR